MFTIFWRTLKDRKISLLVYCLGAILCMWMFVGIFPSIQAQAESFNQIIESYPEGFLAAFGIEQLSFETVQSFLSIEYYTFIFPLLMIFLVVGLAASALAREIEKGTIENILAKSISRTHVFFGKYLAGLVALLLIVICGVFSVVLFGELYDVEYVLQAHASTAVISFLFGWAVLSLGFMFSGIFSERNKASMATGIVLIIMYLANIAASLLEKITNLKYGSLFYYYDYGGALIDLELTMSSVLVLSAVALICTSIGVFWFNKRDIAI